MFSAVFIGNFVQDTILTFGSTTEKHSLGGSVTFGSKAVATFAATSKPDVSIISKVGEKDKEFMESQLKQLSEMGVNINDGIIFAKEGRMTSYKLTYTDPQTNARDLILQRKGYSLHDTKFVIDHLHARKTLPDLIFFVPVAGEFDAEFVKEVVNEIRKDGDSFPFIVTDIQGYVRDFDPQTGAVSIFPSSELIKTLRRLGKFVFFIKCDYDEAKAALRDLHRENDPELTPSDCAVMLHEMFGFRCVAITMGPGGCVVSVAVSEKSTVSVLPCEGRDAHHQFVSSYIPAYTPKRVLDETGSGDTFLASTFAELMLRIGTGKKEIHCDDIFAAVETASAATSYLVERNEPHIFASRETAKLIQEKSPRNKDFVYLYPLFLFFFSNRHFAVSSTTITTIWSTSLF